MTTFKDIRGNTIHIGQEVVYSSGGRYHHFDTHRVLGFTTQRVIISAPLSRKNTVLHRERWATVRANRLVAIPFENAPTVVCVIVPLMGDRLVAIKRANEPEVGKVALPGGYQMKDETWQQAGAREVLEETGIRLAYKHLHQQGPTITDHYGNNVIVAVYNPILEKKMDGSWEYRREAPATPEEVKEVLELSFRPEGEFHPDWAFPIHENATDYWWLTVRGLKPKLDGVR